jgi:2-polyprenyl-3-methyl-5-hydroxy-6-metoxy-1,4-benzoquinol methylase
MAGIIASVADDPLSRRALLRLDFGRARAPRPDPAPYKAGLGWRWHGGADLLLRAWEPLAPVLCDVAGVRPGDRVLDAGTGDGNVALEAARRGATVTGVDLVPAQVTRARERAEAAGLDVDLRTGDVEDLQDADGSYDVVLSAYGATLAPRPRLAVRELLRVLRPGGLLVLAAPGPHSLAARVLELAQEGPGERPRGIPSPAAWGREDLARERIEAVAPGTEVEVRTHPLALAFGSEADAWQAYSGPFGLPPRVRDRFADLIGALSDAIARVEIEEPVTLVLARRRG